MALSGAQGLGMGMEQGEQRGARGSSLTEARGMRAVAQRGQVNGTTLLMLTRERSVGRVKDDLTA